MNMNGILLAIASIAVLTKAALQATWLPMTYRCENSSRVLDTFTSLQARGVQRVYASVWNNGTAYFDSPSLRSIAGNASQGDDILKWALDAGRATGIQVGAWFEFGLMASFKDIDNDFARNAESQGWLIGVHSGFQWLNASKPEVLDVIAELMIDSIRGYSKLGLMAVQLDDHFAQPSDLGGTVEIMDSAMIYVSSKIKSHLERQNLTAQTIFSLSPAPLDLALKTYNVNWAAWGDKGLYQEVIPQLYRPSYKSFLASFNQTLNGLSQSAKSLWIASGLRLDGSGSPTPQSELQQMISHTSAFGIGSFIWYAHGIIELYPGIFGEDWQQTPEVFIAS